MSSSSSRGLHVVNKHFRLLQRTNLEMEDRLDETSDRKDLADFLAKVDEIGAARLVT